MRVLGPDHRRTLDVLAAWSAIAILRGESESALEPLRDGVERACRTLDASDDLTLVLSNNLGKALLVTGHLPDARIALQRAVAGAQTLALAPKLRVRFALNLYETLLRLGQRNEADLLFVGELASVVAAPSVETRQIVKRVHALYEEFLRSDRSQ